MSKAEAIEPKVGQIWRDCDWRVAGRKVRIDKVDERHVYVTTVVPARNSGTKTGQTSRILRSRLRPTSTGYELDQEAPS